MIKFTPAICPYCGAGCSFLLEVIDGTVVGTRPRFAHPISQGKLCIKGWNAHEFIHHEDRLKKPMIKENGAFKEVSWAEAIKLVAKKLGEIRDKYGPDALAFLSSAKCTNEENYLLQKFARVVIGTNNVDHCARLCHASTVAGLARAFGSGAMTNSIADIAEADCVFIIGSDTMSQHPLVARRIIMAEEKGAKIIVADPRSIQISKFADLHLRQKPGSDVALLNGMMKYILDHSLEDKDFISERTEDFEQLREALQGISLKEAEEITDVPEEAIAEAAELYAKAKASCIVYAMGITQHTTGTDNVLSCANLAMLTGNVGRPGTGVNPLRGQNNVQGACDMGALPNLFPGYQAVTDKEIGKKIAGIWGVAKLPSDVGLTVVEMMNFAREGKIKAMYIMGENPMISDPDISHVEEGLNNLDFLVVQDIFPTETAKLADVVLPAASWAEKEGTYTGTDRRVQLSRKAIEPLWESKPDWEIICELARAMGAKDFSFSSPEEIFEEIREVTPPYAGISFARLNQPAGLQWPCPEESHRGTPILHSKQFTRGKGRFHGIVYREPAETPDDEFPFVLTTGRVMSQFHTRSMTGRSPTLDSEFPEAFLEINPEDAARLGINDEDLVEVSSRRGRIETRARVTDKVKPGTVYLPFHFVEAAANRLTNPALDPIAKIPELKVCAVAIRSLKES
ncbi:MAG: formate dehydrogenase subunit alpha [Dehalococcoidia bacterium]|nr:MAG: formate dehydrogenase subunit alpha [Dehalococcoidia bacterium]